MGTHKNIMGPREWIHLAKDRVKMKDPMTITRREEVKKIVGKTIEMRPTLIFTSTRQGNMKTFQNT